MATAEHASPGSGQAMIDQIADLQRPSRPAASVRFREFDVFPAERVLLKRGIPVEIGSRAFDLLCVLLRHRGTVVSKSTIFQHVWPSTMVEESNLRFQMASLRRVLGEDKDIIKTIQGRGYVLIADGRGEHLEPMPRFGVPPTDHGGGPPPRLVESATLDPNDDAIVAVVDDDDATREALEGFLRSSGLAAVCFPSVRAFQERAPELPIHCLILDICMPGRTGLDLQVELLEAGLHVPIIFMSGHADIPMSVRAMKAGAFEFFTKPVRHEELLSAIQQAVWRGTDKLASA